MAYQYDIFISYSHNALTTEWLDTYFQPLLETYLSEALQRPGNIFIDRHGIGTGDSWPERLKNALAFSRCLLALWSPSYFCSEWCMNEFSVMYFRGQQLGLSSNNNPNGLIIPVIIFDGDQFPDFTWQIQHFDCRKFYRIGEGFRKTERFIEFQDKMIDWVPVNVARVINLAPTWSGEWLQPHWLDDIVNQKKLVSVSKFEQPILE